MDPCIRVEDLSKRYRIGTRSMESYRTLRESMSTAAAGAWRRLARLAARSRAGAGDGNGEGAAGDFWALRDISFEIRPGEVVGIVGRNGAGKSTLLKILSRITEPTSGRAEFIGRMGSLLEVGTGFHQELTGRENIYLNGSILGMSRREIARRFDEIVEFSEIGEFLDTPVKRYSSGMYVRLAFAVAAHLEPEILLVDEVLAVGDVKFQKKCLGKMRQVGHSGRTVLFVSHNMVALEALCGRCILLEKGRLKAQGETRTILEKYHEVGEDRAAGSRDLTDHPGRTSNSRSRMSRVTLSDGDLAETDQVRMDSPLSIHVDFDVKGQPIEPVLGVVIKTDLGTPIFGVNNQFIPGYEFGRVSAPSRITCHFDSLPLMPGTYFIDLFLSEENRAVDVVREAIRFDVIPADVFNSGRLPPSSVGAIYWPARFELRDAVGVRA